MKKIRALLYLLILNTDIFSSMWTGNTQRIGQPLINIKEKGNYILIPQPLGIKICRQEGMALNCDTAVPASIKVNLPEFGIQRTCWYSDAFKVIICDNMNFALPPEQRLSYFPNLIKVCDLPMPNNVFATIQNTGPNRDTVRDCFLTLPQ